MSTQTLSPRRTSLKSHVLLAHGGGGQLTDELLRECVLPQIANPALDALLDAGIVSAGRNRLAISTDGYVVQPLFFPGGDIGQLAVCGSVNDVSVCGARPLALALGMILEEGLDKAIVQRVAQSIADASRRAGVPIITGDTKVVGAGQADGMYLTTTAIGLVRDDAQLGFDRVQPGDRILINGAIGDHGLAVMLARQMPDVRSVVRSDVAPLNGLIHSLLDALGDKVVFMRDATRGGLSAVVTDLAERTGRHVIVDEPAVPIHPQTHHAAEMLGLDVLEAANEGKVVVVVRPDAAEAALQAMRSHRLGAEAALIGSIGQAPDAVCEVTTAIGGRRILHKPYGEQLPRIC